MRPAGRIRADGGRGVPRPGGAVAALEVSRFARNSHDWQRLVEVCRVVDTLLIDQEAVYSLRQGNDRLLLGLKGSLNEYELDLFRQRSVEARHAKARRGELVVAAPIGYLRTEDQRLEMDPDRRVQEAVRRVFRKFADPPPDSSFPPLAGLMSESDLRVPVTPPATSGGRP